jgi:hypothetical protein
MRFILVSRAARSLAYGALAVVLAEALAARGLSPIGIGAAITAALGVPIDDDLRTVT